jgi:hypothetical protein
MIYIAVAHYIYERRMKYIVYIYINNCKYSDGVIF